MSKQIYHIERRNPLFCGNEYYIIKCGLRTLKKDYIFPGGISHSAITFTTREEAQDYIDSLTKN